MRSTLTGKSPRASQGSSEHSSRTMFKRRSFRVAALFCMRAHRSLVVVSVSAMETQRMGEMSLLDGACLIGRVLCQMGRENVERCRRGGRVFGHVSWWHPLSRRIGVGHVRGSRKRRVGSVFEEEGYALSLCEKHVGITEERRVSALDARHAPARIGCYDGSTMFGTSAGQRQTPTDSFGARIPAQPTARSAALHAGPSEAARADADRAGQWSVTKR